MERVGGRSRSSEFRVSAFITPKGPILLSRIFRKPKDSRLSVLNSDISVDYKARYHSSCLAKTLIPDSHPLASLHKSFGFCQPKSCSRIVINTKLTLAMERLEENELEELVIPIWHDELEGLRLHVVLRWSIAGKYILIFNMQAVPYKSLIFKSLIWYSLPFSWIYPQCSVPLFRGVISNRKQSGCSQNMDC